MRRSDLFLAFLMGEMLLLLVLFTHAFSRQSEEMVRIERQARWAGNLGLTDLSLFTEASYTRHLSQADKHTPFQDHPFCLEHFPSGAIFMPPKVTGTYVRMD